MQKVFMLIKRGLTDNTLVCVYPWERPILNEIHGGSAQLISLEKVCDLDGGKVKDVKPKVREINGKKIVCDKSPGMREQYEALLKVDPDRNPLKDPEAEFQRLAALYGMHTQINLPNVEKVYGSPVGFRVALKEYAAGRDPMDDNADTGAIEDKPVAEMTDEEIRVALRAKEVKFRKGADREELEERYTGMVAA